MISHHYWISTEDIADIARNLEPRDREELLLQRPEASSMEDILTTSVELSDVAAVAVDDLLRPIALFGIASELDVGFPWAVFTPECRQYPKQMLKWGSRFVNLWNEDFHVLYGRVYSRNYRAVRFLSRLGFQFGLKEPDDFVSFYRYPEEQHV